MNSQNKPGTITLAPKHTHTISSTSAVAKSTPLSGLLKYEAPTVYYTQEVLLAIQYIVAKSTKEVGWLGLVEEGPGYYVIREIFVPEQKVTAVTTEIEPDAMIALTLKLLAEGKDPSMLRYWGHSHVNMGVTPSTTDENQVEEYLEHADWFIRGIYNKAGASKVDVYDVEGDVIHQCVKNIVVPSKLPDDYLEALDNILAANVKVHVHTPYNYAGLPYGNYKRGEAYPGGKGNLVGGRSNLFYAKTAEDEEMDNFTNMYEGMVDNAINSPLTQTEQMEICAFFGMAYDADADFTQTEILNFRIHDPFYVGKP
jgi:hypothetical protein